MGGSTFVGGSIDIHVRFEALGGNARRSQVYRRHEDLQRAYEHKVMTLTRETRHVTSKLNRIQNDHVLRMKAISRLEPVTYKEEWPPLEERIEIERKLLEAPLVIPGAAASPKKEKPKRTGKMAQKKPDSKLVGKVDRQRLTAEGTKKSPEDTVIDDVDIVAQENSPNSDLDTTVSLESTNGNLSMVNSPYSKMLGRPHWAPHTIRRASQPSVEPEAGRIRKLGVASSTPNGQKQAASPAPEATTPAQSSPKGHGLPTVTISQTKSSTDLKREPPLSEGDIPPSEPDPAKQAASKPVEHRESKAKSKPTWIPLDKHPKWRSRRRNGWGRQERVLLFSLESRDGEVTYTHVTKRRYPSIV